MGFQFTVEPKEGKWKFKADSCVYVARSALRWQGRKHGYEFLTDHNEQENASKNSR
jgi:hypothetical protein